MERVVREAGIVTNLLDTPRINDVDDVINRDGRFGDVGGQHDLAEIHICKFGQAQPFQHGDGCRCRLPVRP